MHETLKVPSERETLGGQAPRRTENREVVHCFTCGKKGHIARHCRTNALFCIGLPGDIQREGTVNGRCARNIMLTRVVQGPRPGVSKEQTLDGKSAVVKCAHGDNVLYPMAKVNVEVDGCTIPHGLMFQNSGKLLSRVSTEFREQSNAQVATTRAKAKQEAEAERGSLQKPQQSSI